MRAFQKLWYFQNHTLRETEQKYSQGNRSYSLVFPTYQNISLWTSCILLRAKVAPHKSLQHNSLNFHQSFCTLVKTGHILGL